MSQERFTRERGGPPGPRETRWTWLLLVPLAGTLIPPIYNTRTRALRGAVLLLVPDALGAGQRAGHGDRLPRRRGGGHGSSRLSTRSSLTSSSRSSGSSRCSASSPRAGGGRRRSTTSTSGASAGATSAPGSRGSSRRRPLHRVHVRRRPRAGVRRRRARLLRRALHDRRLPDGVPRRPRGCGRSRTATATSPPPTSSAAASAPATLALAIAITGIVATMPYIALQLVGIEAVLKTMGITAHWPIIIAFARPRRVHVPVGPARAGADRVRQGLADLPRRDRRGHLHPDPARRLRRHLRGGGREVRRQRDRRPTACCSATPRCSATRRWRSARRSRCSSIRTR